MKRVAAVFALVMTAVCTLPAQSAKNGADLLRQDARSAKKEMVSLHVKISDPQKEKLFWSIYGKYEESSKKESEAYADFLKKYASDADAVSAKNAEKITAELLRISEARTKLLNNTCLQIQAGVSAEAAARFMLIEDRFALLEEFQIASGYPITLPKSVGSKMPVEVVVE